MMLRALNLKMVLAGLLVMEECLAFGFWPEHGSLGSEQGDKNSLNQFWTKHGLDPHI